MQCNSRWHLSVEITFVALWQSQASPALADESFPAATGGGSRCLPHLLCREVEMRGETRQRALCIAIELPPGCISWFSVCIELSHRWQRWNPKPRCGTVEILLSAQREVWVYLLTVTFLTWHTLARKNADKILRDCVSWQTVSWWSHFKTRAFILLCRVQFLSSKRRSYINKMLKLVSARRGGGRSLLETPSQSMFSQCPICVSLVILALCWGQSVHNSCQFDLQERETKYSPSY